MEFRCFSSVGALALLIGSVGCALLAPAARAGDRIEFSAPAIPLAVPQPDVEIKQSQEMTFSPGAAARLMDGANMPAPQQYIVGRPKSRERNSWAANSLRNDDPDQRNADDWLNSRPESNPLTNGSISEILRGADARNPGSLLQRRNDVGFEAGQNGSRLETQTRFDRDHSREGDVSGRGSSSDHEGSLWNKASDRDSSSAIYQLNGGRFVPFMEEFRMSAGGAYGQRMNSPAPPADPARDMALPAGNGGYNPMDDSRNRQTSDEADTASQGYLRAWEPAPSRRLPARTSSNPDQINPSRVLAPNRPVNLPMPRRPGDPF